VLDREFSTLELVETLVTEKVNFVIRLKGGPNFCNGEGKVVVLSVKPGETRILNKLFSKGRVFVNGIGLWKKGLSEPIWITPDHAAGARVSALKAKDGLAICEARLKIQETFRDLNRLLNFHKMMNKCRSLMEKMAALILLAYALAWMVGETLRARLFPAGHRKKVLFSGPLVFLKLKPDLPPTILSQAPRFFLNSFYLSELMSEGHSSRVLIKDH
jgi:hypothetical protein